MSRPESPPNASAFRAMSRLNGGTLRFLERVKTRDARVPLSADDPEMENGWRCIPVPPTDDDRWFILDSSRDYKTEWGRWHEIGSRA